MKSIQDFAPEIQQRLSGFVRYLTMNGFSRPEVKNVGALLSGILKRPTVQVSGISRMLEEEIAPKKTEERLHRNLRREGLGLRLLEANAGKHGGTIRRMRYCIIDTSDIQKPYSKKMDGLSVVRDGDKSGRGEVVTGEGLHWINGVMADGADIVPVYSEIYGLEHEVQDRVSENTKILGIMNLVRKIHPDAIYVLDRGGDRSVLMDDCIKYEMQFVIRCQSLRSLGLHRDSGHLTNIKKIAKRVRTEHAYRSVRNGEWYDVGIKRVYYGETPLWLVVSRRRRHGGLSWYLTNVKDSRTVVMNTVMEAYGLRWRVEEYHRQIKQDYGLESLCLRKYAAIKNMAVLVMLAAALCAMLPRELVIKMVTAAHRLPRNRLRDIPLYAMYMIVAAVAWALETTVRRPPPPLRIRKRIHFQLMLPFPAL